MNRVPVILAAMAIAALSLFSPGRASAAQPHITAGLAFSPSSDGFMWTPSKVLRWDDGLSSYTATEVTAGGAITAVQGIVSSPGSDVFIWTPSKVFRWDDGLSSYTATEVKEGGTASIFSYDPAQVAIVQVVVHHEGAVGDVYHGSSGAGIVGQPASSPVGYAGSATAATIVPSSATAPSAHSTVIGAAVLDDTGLILGPNPVPGVVSGNSMIVFAFAPAVGGIAELPDVAGTSPQEAGAPAEGSGWSAGNYAALAGGLAAALLVLSAGAWYARRRWVR